MVGKRLSRLGKSALVGFIGGVCLVAGVAGAAEPGSGEADKKVESPASDASFFDGARGRIGFEYEYEKSAKDDVTNTAFAIMPGIQFRKDLFLSRAELYFEGNQDNLWSNNSNGNTTETKIGVRLRKDFDLGQGFGCYIRGLMGRAMSSDQNFNYYYMEPAVKYDFNKTFGMLVGYRLIRTFSGPDGAEKNKLRIGPNINIDKNQALELRYVYATAAHGGDHISDAYIVEYAYKF